MTGHSKLGASSAHRWMHCPGSVALIARLGMADEDRGSEHAARGTVAHTVFAECLEKGQDTWEYAGFTSTVDGHKITMDSDDLAAVQAAVDAVRADGNYKWASENADRNRRAFAVLIEQAFHCPEIHEDMYGTSDLVVISPDQIDVWDYKHGVGVVVEVEENPQLLQYAAGVLRSLALEDIAIPEKVVLHIAQPRGIHPRPIREWATTKTYVENWITETWLPAARKTEGEGAPLNSGDHCRFCPLKDALACPELLAAVDRAKAAALEKPEAMDDWQIGATLADIKVLRIFEKALESEAFNRLSKGRLIDGWKLADKRADRVWKDGAEVALIESLGDAAWQPKVMVSPAQAEKLPGGGALVAKWAFKPNTGLTLAPVKDAREGRKARSAKEVFKGLLDDGAPK